MLSSNVATKKSNDIVRIFIATTKNIDDRIYFTNQPWSFMAQHKRKKTTKVHILQKKMVGMSVYFHTFVWMNIQCDAVGKMHNEIQ